MRPEEMLHATQTFCSFNVLHSCINTMAKKTRKDSKK